MGRGRPENGDEKEMLRDLLDSRCKAKLEKVEMNALEAPAEDAERVEIIMDDSIRCVKKPDALRVECTRKVGFDPACSFEITVMYSVEHSLKETSALEAVPQETIEKEVRENIQFYIQENRGLMNRVSLIIAQLTSAFEGVPMVLPPYFQTERPEE